MVTKVRHVCGNFKKCTSHYSQTKSHIQKQVQTIKIIMRKCTYTAVLVLDFPNMLAMINQRTNIICSIDYVRTAYCVCECSFHIFQGFLYLSVRYDSLSTVTVFANVMTVHTCNLDMAIKQTENYHPITY